MVIGSGGRPVRSEWTGYVVVAVVVVLWAALVSCDVGGGGGGGGHGDHEGPVAADFVQIADVAPAPPPPAAASTGSAGTFSEDCGRNQQGIRNADNLITSPGESGGAHHAHDYVGNVSTNAFSTDDSLAAAATTCADGDRSTFFWPVLLVSDGSAATATNGDNLRVRIPDSVLVEFRGSPVSNVVPMPRFLRVLEGNPHGLTAGGADTEHVQWSCSGDRARVTRQYPLCPAGQQVVRIFDFPSCWNGKTLDSRDHHSHLLYPGPSGLCQGGTFPVPQLHIEVAYTIPPGAQYAVDSFPEELRSPISDHAGYVNVMTDALMAKVVDCLNSGQRCTS
ncbi:DUF1996 domain-containing protein [Pseudonocardia xinjiangensis]|uniref:DUF1996 domain-containing protein n=1 Tax=Pseudonocardia xinjiangensis TaxID=75289 RepID=UPI003D8FF656